MRNIRNCCAISRSEVWNILHFNLLAITASALSLLALGQLPEPDLSVRCSASSQTALERPAGHHERQAVRDESSQARLVVLDLKFSSNMHLLSSSVDLLLCTDSE